MATRSWYIPHAPAVVDQVPFVWQVLVGAPSRPRSQVAVHVSPARLLLAQSKVLLAGLVGVPLQIFLHVPVTLL